MPIADLAAFGLVPCEVQAFGRLLRTTGARAEGSLELTPLQALAAKRGLFGDRPQPCLVLAGAATGKSTLAALLLLHASHQGKNVVLLQPRRADRRRTRAALADVLPRDEVQPIVRSVRQFLQRIRRRPLLLQDLDLLVLDDADWLLRPRAARKFDVLLRAIKKHAPSLQLVAFAADQAATQAVANLAEPLRAEVLYGPPAEPIAMGLVNQGRVEAWTDPSVWTADDIAETVPAGHNDQPGQLQTTNPSPLLGLANTLLLLTPPGEQTLVLVPQRSQMLHLLQRLLDGDQRLRMAPALQAQKALATTAEGHGRSLLSQVLQHGLAFDGPELTREQRRIVAEARANGEVRLCLCHRLPSRSGLSVKVHNLVVVPQASAHRLANSDASAVDTSHWRTFPSSRVRRQLGPQGRLLIVAQSPQAAAAALRQLASPATGDPFSRARETAHLHAHDGLAAFLRFLPAQPVEELARLEALTLAALSGPRLPLPLLLSERAGFDYATQLLCRAQEQGLLERPLFRWLGAQAPKLGHEDLRALKSALLLDDWLAGMNCAALERRYHIWAGQLAHCARHIVQRLLRLQRRSQGLALAAAGHTPLASLIQQLQGRAQNSVAEHRAAELGRHFAVLVGALNAHESPPTRSFQGRLRR